MAERLGAARRLDKFSRTLEPLSIRNDFPSSITITVQNDSSALPRSPRQLTSQSASKNPALDFLPSTGGKTPRVSRSPRRQSTEKSSSSAVYDKGKSISESSSRRGDASPSLSNRRRIIIDVFENTDSPPNSTRGDATPTWHPNSTRGSRKNSPQPPAVPQPIQAQPARGGRGFHGASLQPLPGKDADAPRSSPLADAEVSCVHGAGYDHPWRSASSRSPRILSPMESKEEAQYQSSKPNRRASGGNTRAVGRTYTEGDISRLVPGGYSSARDVPHGCDILVPVPPASPPPIRPHSIAARMLTGSLVKPNECLGSSDSTVDGRQPGSPRSDSDSECAAQQCPRHPAWAVRNADADNPMCRDVSRKSTPDADATPVVDRRPGCRNFWRAATLPTRQVNGGGGYDICSAHELGAAMQSIQRSIRPLPDGVKIFDLYRWDKALQEDGDGGKVVICRRKTSIHHDQDIEAVDADEDFVLKIRPKTVVGPESEQEAYRRSLVRMLNSSPHSGIAWLHDVFEDASAFYVVMEKANCGMLFDGLLADHPDGNVPHDVIRRVMREIFESVEHLHSQGMLHRDLKPDNMCLHLHRSESQKRVMLIDFDHLDPDWEKNSLRRDVSEENNVWGTLRFNAPETFFGKYTRGSDLYSIGVLFYLLMTGKMPYDDSCFEDTGAADWQNKMHKRLSNQAIDWKCDPWTTEPTTKNFCQRLLSFQVESRFASAWEALEHPWFRSE